MEDIAFYDAVRNSFTNYADLSPSLETSKFPNFISPGLPSYSSCSKEIVSNTLDLEIHTKIKKIAQNQNIVSACEKSGGSGEAKIDISWGDKEGAKVRVGVSGEIHDNQGNYIKGKASQDSNGEGNVSISAGIKKESSSNNK